MALAEDGGNMVMPVSPMGSNGGFGGFGGDWSSWIILFLIFGMFGGWGNGFGGGYGANSLSYDFPWLLNANNNTDNLVSSGFQNAALQNYLTGIQSSITSGFGDTALGIAGLNQNICQTGNGITNAITQSQISAMQNANALQSQLAQCCCDNRLATCQTQNIVQNEGNATRFADATNTRDIIQSQTQGTQAILDKLCQLELDNVKSQVEAKNDRIAELQTQLNFANLAASQTAQTAQIKDGQLAATTALVNELRSCPIPSQPVFGSQPIFSCPTTNGCGCGNNGFVA